MHVEYKTSLPIRPVVVAAALVVGLVPVATAQAAIPGIHDDQLTDTTLDVETRAGLIEASGAGVAKVDVRWSRIAPVRPRTQTDPSDDAYRFDRLDEIVTSLAARNITPAFVVYSTPRWAARSRAFSGVSGAPRASQFGKFMQALARRYSGQYVDISRGTLPRVRHYEIWNEPNNGRFLKPQRRGKRTLSLGSYVSLVRAAYPRIKKVNPRAVVIAGSTAPRGRSSRSGIAARDWLRGLIRSSARFDAYSLHLSANTPPRSRTAAYPHWGSLSGIANELDAVERRKGTPLYVTQAGYATASSRLVKTSVSAPAQARYLRQIFSLPIIRSERVPLVVWSNLQDSTARSTGLLSSDGTQKSSFVRFLGVAKRSPVLPRELRR